MQFALQVLVLLCISFMVFVCCDISDLPERIVYAINCGGGKHVDTYGVHYDEDPLEGEVGISSNYGMNLLIRRVPAADAILYQTERYHTATFSYEIPININNNEDYVLVLKFSEVYFNAPRQKVFDVVLNGAHVVVPQLDIFDRVGRGVAHDEHIPFSIRNGRLHVGSEESHLNGPSIRIDFLKSNLDNPKINAIYVAKGQLIDVPQLPPLSEHMPADDLIDTDLDDEEAMSDFDTVESRWIRTTNDNEDEDIDADDYLTEQSVALLPVFIALAACVPVLYCLCKL